MRDNYIDDQLTFISVWCEDNEADNDSTESDQYSQ
jgi:hypothetical protein